MYCLYVIFCWENELTKWGMTKLPNILLLFKECLEYLPGMKDKQEETEDKGLKTQAAGAHTFVLLVL